MGKGGKNTMRVLTKTSLINRLRNPEEDFAIGPLLEETQVDYGAVNLRLGLEFILLRETRYPFFCPKNID